MLGVFVDTQLELKDIERELSIMETKLEYLAKETNPVIRDSHIRAIAGCIHGIYVGIENILKTLVKHFDGSVPEGENWHLQLLKRASSPIENTRPAIIHDQNTSVVLDELRAFRHVFRNKYQSLLIPERVLRLAKLTSSIVPKFKAEILFFQKAVEENINNDRYEDLPGNSR